MDAIFALLFDLFVLVAIAVFLLEKICVPSIPNYRYIGIQGAIGWLLAFIVRLVPLNIIQGIMLGALGATEENYELFLKRWEVLIWGPILAGLVEEFTRYIFYKNYPEIPKNRPVGAIAFGLGWAIGEVIIIFGGSIITLFAQGSLDLDFWGIFIPLWERIAAGSLHVALSVMVVYSLFWKDRHRSLYLAIVFHILFDMVIVFFIIVVDMSNDLTWIVLLETTLSLMSVSLLAFVFRYYIPKQEALLPEGALPG